MAFTPSMLSSRAKLANEVAWFKSRGLSLKHWSSHWYLEMRQECQTFKNVTSSPCDWLLLVLAIRAWGAPSINKQKNTNGKIDEWKSIWNKNYPTLFYLVDETMNICESYLTETYLKTSKASSCRCTWIVMCLHDNHESFSWFLEKTSIIW